MSRRQQSTTRRIGFNKERVNYFFDKCEDLLDEHKFTADQIYHVEETAVQIYQEEETAMSTLNKASWVVAQKRKHQVEAIISGEVLL